MLKQMNYAVVILAFVMILATGYWWAKGRNYYTGPRVTAHVVDGGIVLAEDNEKLSDSEQKPAGLGAQLS
jgi:uncharacterized membrane protein YqiK